MPREILIVESDAAVASALRQALEGAGFSAEILEDASTCVERARQSRPDLVILSVALPDGQNGYLICGKMKKDEGLAHIPIIITGNPDGFEMHRRLKTRADGYLPVPVDTSALVQLAQSLTQGEGALGARTESRQDDVSRPSPAPKRANDDFPSAPENAGPPWALVFLALAVALLVGAWLTLR